MARPRPVPTIVMVLLAAALLLGGTASGRSADASTLAVPVGPDATPDPTSRTTDVAASRAATAEPRAVTTATVGDETPQAVAAAPSYVPVEVGWFLTATPRGRIPAYDRAFATEPTTYIDDKYYDIATALPVFEQVEGWLHVRLAPKPNGSAVWIKASDAEIGTTPWRIVVNLTTTHLQLYKAGELVLDAPVGVGTDYTPTVTGDYFATFLQTPTSSAYGPFVMITSGHSEVLLTWEGFPDGILAIHGPIGSDGMIGTAGAKLSNGCIRMHVADQQQLAEVLPGSPIQIIGA